MFAFCNWAFFFPLQNAAYYFLRESIIEVFKIYLLNVLGRSMQGLVINQYEPKDMITYVVVVNFLHCYFSFHKYRGYSCLFGFSFFFWSFRPVAGLPAGFDTWFFPQACFTLMYTNQYISKSHPDPHSSC